MSEPEEEKIDATFRNGSVTAVGIILGFSFSMISNWVSNPNDWSRIDILPSALLLAGIVIQVKALADLLARDSLLVVKYDQARRLFMVGVLVLAIGMAVALANDILGLGKMPLLG